MSDALALSGQLALSPENVARAPAPRKASWSLMGDILAARGGVPEQLIQWCRASGEDDPAPRL